MTPEDIKKLPTPETDQKAITFMPGVSLSEESKPLELVNPAYARSLEQQRDALLDDLQELLQDIEQNAAIGEPDWTGIEVRIHKKLMVLASIRQMKEGK